MLNISLRVLSITLFAMFALASFGQCETQIKDFYIAYMRNLEHNEAANADLLKSCMKPDLIARLAEDAQRQDADAIIHAQDVCNYCTESLVVSPTENKDEYLVKYKWAPESEYTTIKIKATDANGKFTILDILP